MDCKLSIIIVNWNTRQLLGQCLASLYANPPGCLFEAYVVDNASNDGSAALVRDFFPRVRLIANQVNLGFAAANNQGIRESSGDHLLLLNSDTLVHPDALDSVVEFLDLHPQTGIVGVRLLNPDGSLQHYPTSFTRLSNQWVTLWHLPGRRQFLVGRTAESQPYAVERVQGAGLAVRRSVLDAVGLLDETTFLYGEEDDLCFHARRAGWHVIFLPTAQITHYGGASTAKTNADALVHLYSSKIWFVRKYYGARQALGLKIVVAIAYWARLVAASLAQSASARHAQRHAYRRLLRALNRL